ncbi:MAG: hypothetical protein HYZ00_11105, partial [Candidatus Hydrogenedentes bacterium]|nr:hypothetical protein [Candidatus Hydrogenedentota bacterium]
MVRTFLVQTSLITLCALGVTVVLATDAAAQRVIVVANTMSATQEAARLYVHSVDFQAGVLPGATPLLGTTALGTLTPAPDGRYLLVASGWPAPVSGPVSPTEPCCVNVICARPFQVVEAARRVAAPGWREWPVGTLNVSPGAAVVLLGEAKADGEEWGGKLEVVAWDEDGLFGGTLGRWELPQRPLAAVALPGAPARWVVLCQSAAATPPVLAVADLTGVQENGGPESQPSLGELTFVEVAAPADSLNISASALLPSPDGDGVLVMLSGYRAREQTRDQVTWVSHAQGPDLSMGEAPVEIPGVAANTTPFVAAGDKVWALTILPGTGHAYAARIGIAGGTPRKEEQYILSGAQQALRLAVAPEGGDVAVALDERVEVWPAGMRGDASFAFERPIAMLEWIPNGLLAAEGGRLHLIDPSREHLGRPRASALQLQSGQAGLIAVLGAPLVDDMDNDGLFAAEEAAGGTSPDGADSDEDGIHDGIDPSPQLASPGLRVTPLVTLQGDAAGRELKAVSIDVGPFPNLPWEIDYDRAALPWLVIHPLAGRGSGVSYLGIDPAAYPGQPGAGGSLV